MNYCFWTVAGVGLAYFTLAMRRVDAFSVGFFSALIYFSPGFVGYVLYPGVLGFEDVALVPQAYLAMAIVLATILAGGALWDCLAPIQGPQFVLAGSQLAPILAVFIGVVGLVGTWLTVGDVLLMEDKVQILNRLDRWYVLFTNGALVGAVLCFGAKRRVLLAAALLLLVVDLVVGFRASLAAAVIAMLMLAASQRGPYRLLRNWRVGVFGAMFLGAIILYKGALVFVKTAQWGMIVQAIADPEWYVAGIAHSEPFITQSILNEVLQTGFTVDPSYLRTLVYQALLFTPELGGDVVSFNDLFQPALFPGSEWMGMANNLWAEAISVGGWLGLIVSSMMFTVMLAFGSYLLLARDKTLRVGAALASSWLAFYSHRNDLLNLLNLEKRVLLVWAACVLVSMFVLAALARPVPDGRTT